MVHYIFLRFKENTLTENVINGIADKLDELEKQCEGITNPQIYRNIVSCNENMDLMITIELRTLEDLNVYLESEAHHTLYEKYSEIVEKYFTFDHN